MNQLNKADREFIEELNNQLDLKGSKLFKLAKEDYETEGINLEYIHSIWYRNPLIL